MDAAFAVDAILIASSVFEDAALAVEGSNNEAEVSLTDIQTDIPPYIAVGRYQRFEGTF